MYPRDLDTGVEKEGIEVLICINQVSKDVVVTLIDTEVEVCSYSYMHRK